MLDEYAAALNSIAASLGESAVAEAPKNTAVGKVDEVKASHPMTLKVRW